MKVRIGNVPFISQYAAGLGTRNNYCGMACVAMSAAYYGKLGHQVSVEDVKRAASVLYPGGRGSGTGSDVYGQKRMAEAFGLVGTGVAYGRFEDLKAALRRNHPCVVSVHNQPIALGPIGLHTVLALGFDEEQSHWCFHDPQGAEHNGAYRWVRSDFFRSAVAQYVSRAQQSCEVVFAELAP